MIEQCLSYLTADPKSLGIVLPSLRKYLFTMTSDMADAQRIREISDYNKLIHISNYVFLGLNILAVGFFFLFKFPDFDKATMIATIVTAIGTVLSILNIPFLDRFMTNRTLLLIQIVLFAGLVCLNVWGIPSKPDPVLDESIRSDEAIPTTPVIDTTIKK